MPNILEFLDDVYFSSNPPILGIVFYDGFGAPLPEPEPEQDISEYGNCGPGTTLQDGICVVNSENESTDTDVKWGGPYDTKQPTSNLNPILDYDYEFIYMIILITVGIIAGIAGVAFFVRIRRKRK